MKIDIGRNLGWTLFGITGLIFYIIVFILGTSSEEKADQMKERTKQLELQWKLDSIATLNAVPYDVP